MAEYHFAESEGLFLGHNTWSAPWSSLEVIEPYVKEYNISLPRDSYVINLNGELVNLEYSYNNFTTPLSNNQTSINYLYPIFMDKLAIGEEGLNIYNTKSDTIVINVSDDEPAKLKSELNIYGKPVQLYIFSKSGFSIENLELSNLPKLSLIAADFKDYFGEGAVYEYDITEFNEQKFYKSLNQTTILGNISGNNTILEFYTNLNSCKKGNIEVRSYNILINDDSKEITTTSPLNYSSCNVTTNNFELQVPSSYRNLYFSGNLKAKEVTFITSGPLLLNNIIFNITNSLDIVANKFTVRGNLFAGNFTLATETYYPITADKIVIEGDFHWTAKTFGSNYVNAWEPRVDYGNIKGTFGFIGNIHQNTGVYSTYIVELPSNDGFVRTMGELANLEELNYGGLYLEIYNNNLITLSPVNATGPVKIYATDAEIIINKIQAYGEISLRSDKKICISRNTEIMALGDINLQAPNFNEFYGLYRSNQNIVVNSTEELKIYGKFQSLGNVTLIAPKISFYSRAIESEQATIINVEKEVYLGQNSKIQTKDLVVTKSDGTRIDKLSLHSASIEVRNNAVVKASSVELAPYNLVIGDEIYETGFQDIGVYRHTQVNTHVECHRDKYVLIRSYIDVQNDFTVDTQSFSVDKSNVYAQGKIEFVNVGKAVLNVKGQAFYKWGEQWSDGPRCWDGGIDANNLIREKCGIVWHWTHYRYGDYVCGKEAAKARLQSPTPKYVYHIEHGSFIGVKGIHGNFNQISVYNEGTFSSNIEDTHFMRAGNMLGTLNSNQLTLPTRINDLQIALEKHLVMLDPNRKVEAHEQVVRPLQGLNKARFESNDYIANPYYSLPTLQGDSNKEAYDYFYTLRYQPLKSCSIGIDYILKQLKVPPESVGKIFCESNCQLELVKSSLERKTGFRDLSVVLQELRDYFKDLNINEQRDRDCLTVKYLLDNAVAVKDTLGAVIGQPISEKVFDSIDKPFIWPVYENYEGFKILAPVVYFPKDLLSTAPTRNGAFITAGASNIKVDNLFIGSAAYIQEGSIQANNLAIAGEIKKAKGGVLTIEAENIVTASMMYIHSTNNGFYTERLSYAGIEAEGELVLLVNKDFMIQGAKLEGRITAHVGRDIIVIPARMLSMFEHYEEKGYIRHASLNNILNKFKGDISLNSKGKQYYEGVIAEGGSNINLFSEKNSIELVVAVDKNFHEQQKTKERVFSDKTTTHTSYQETAKGNQLGELTKPLRSLTIESYGDVALYAAKVYTKKLYMEAGVNNPEKADVILGSVGLQSFEQTTVEKSGLGFGNGMVGIKTTTTVTQNSRVNQEPSVIVVVGDKNDPADNTAYIVTNGKYTQLSSHINHETGKFVIIAPEGIEIGANDNEIVNIVHTTKEMVGFGVSATKEEIGLKMGVEIRESYRENVNFTPVQSSITAKQLELHSKNGYLHTRGAILTYQDALIKGLGHIDEPAEQRSSQLNKEFSASLHFKLGFRSSLSNAIDSTKDTFQSNVDTPEGAINAAFKAHNMLINWAKFVTMPVQGGMYIHGKMKKERLEITRVEPVVSEFTSFGNTTHETDKIYFKGTKIIGYKWYVRAKDVHLAAAFSSYEESRSGSSGEIIIPLGGGIIPSLSVTPISKNKGSVQNYHMLQVMIKDEIIFDIGGPVNIEGGYMEADKIVMNAKSLVLKSVQRLAESKSSGFSLSGSDITSIDTVLTGGGGYYGRSETKWIEEIAGIIGKEKLELVINETLKIAGAVIANAERNENGTYTDKGKLYIKAAEVIAESIYGYDEGILLGASYSSGSG
ncbi:hypothetical protein H1Q59_08235, partial [Holosporaceae bacterium 'Namur']|nr:hypothetical protein [Holosporaceae bacterium 'Namur']